LRALLALALLPLGALAQHEGPEVEACRAFGERELRKLDPGMRALAIDQDRHLFLERGKTRIGSQPVSAVLSGHGGVVREAGPPVEIAFRCVLAGGREALWFHWVPRRDAPALAQCRRGTQPGDCLDLLLEVAERDLIELSTQRYHDSMAAGDEAATRAFREAASAWRSYRDLECARRGAAGGDEWRACRIDLTRRRHLDLQ
jgi:uncharacterized protein YecT (DUF1311 family)